MVPNLLASFTTLQMHDLTAYSLNRQLHVILQSKYNGRASCFEQQNQHGNFSIDAN